jgi:hypothetical protein
MPKTENLTTYMLPPLMRGKSVFSTGGRHFALVAKWYASVFANSGWRVSSKSEGVKSPSKSEKVRGFPDFRGNRVFAVSKTARQIACLRSIFEGKRQEKRQPVRVALNSMVER